MLAVLDAWSRAHALIVLAACGVSLVTGAAGWVSGVAALSLAVLVARCRQWFGAERGFGRANWVTSFRLCIAATLPAFPPSTPGFVLAAVVLFVFVLDGLDGWIARRTGTASEFGAHFDMETDASFVLIAELVLLSRGDAGAWIVVTGLLRYLYVLVVACVPPRAGAARRSRFARLAFACLVVGLIAAFALPKPFGAALALVGSAAVSASFARSFYAAYRGPSGPAPASHAETP